MGYKEELIQSFLSLGIHAEDVVLLHTSLKGLNAPGISPDDVIQALQQLLTDRGTLLVPALSYANVTGLNPTFHAGKTPSCIGALPERFRLAYADHRSLHPTHSVCAWGRYAYAMTAWHGLDHTPVGSHSPFMQLPNLEGKILMLGCGLRPNTFMHGVEEAARAPYPLARTPILYTLTDENGKTSRKEYFPHQFGSLRQRYDRLADLLPKGGLNRGEVLGGEGYLIRADAALMAGAEAIRNDPYYFVEQGGEACK